MTPNLHDKMLAAIDAYFSASDAVEKEEAEDLLLDVRDELLKQLAPVPEAHKQSAERGEPVAWIDEQLQMLNFLYGAGEFEGVWFDQKHPTEKGAFWWRKHLRRLFNSSQPPRAYGTLAQPLTDERIEIGRRAPWGEALDPFTAGVRFAETHYGITKGGEA